MKVGLRQRLARLRAKNVVKMCENDRLKSLEFPP